MKYNDNGTVKNIVVKAGDTLPIGTIVEYDGTTIPAGYEEVPNDLLKTNAQSLEFGFDEGFNLIINFADGTRARLRWNDENITFSYYDGSQWLTRWTK